MPTNPASARWARGNPTPSTRDRAASQRMARGNPTGVTPVSSPRRSTPAPQRLARGNPTGPSQRTTAPSTPRRPTAQSLGGGGDVDRFMWAISAQESGHDPSVTNRSSGAHGQFQIMPANWSPWAREAGLPGDAPQTAANQNRVARHKMQQYYRDFGSWDAVAVAWFAGPGRARRYLDGDRSVLNLSDGNMTVGQYVDKMNRGMSSAPGTPAPSDTANPGAQIGATTGPFAGAQHGDGQLTYDAGAMMAEVFATLSDAVAGRNADSRLSFGGRRDQPGGGVGIREGEPLPGIAGQGATQAAEALFAAQAGADGGDIDEELLARVEQNIAAMQAGEEPPNPPPAIGVDGPGADVLAIGEQYLGVPYLWGGTSPSGFDCSGLVQYVYKQLGIDLPRFSGDQAQAGTEVGSLDQAQPGDLVFWSAGGGRSTNHIGIYAGNGRFLEAPRTGLDVRYREIGETPDAIRRVI